MCNITLISTMHSEYGLCTSEELFKIIREINPEVIFEELSKDLHDIIYIENPFHDSQYPPEIRTIKKIKASSIVNNIPVDIDVRNFMSTEELNFMFDKFKSHDEYKNLEKEQEDFTRKEGFKYLNSKNLENNYKKRKEFEEQLSAIGGFGTEIIQKLYSRFNEEQNLRENSMLTNIYNYSKSNPYQSAVFTLGVAHRLSIKEKIKAFQKGSAFKLNWKFYGE